MSIIDSIYPLSRLLIVDALMKQMRPVTLRQLAKLTKLSVRATEINLQALNDQKLVTTSRVANRLNVSLVESHYLHAQIKKIISQIESSSLAEKGQNLATRATQTLSFNDEGAALIARAKKR